MQTANILDAEAVLFILCLLAIQFHPSRIILYFSQKIPRHERVGTLKNGLWNEEREMRVA